MQEMVLPLCSVCKHFQISSHLSISLIEMMEDYSNIAEAQLW